jgi:SAM-dependent methyltransferase
MRPAPGPGTVDGMVTLDGNVLRHYEEEIDESSRLRRDGPDGLELVRTQDVIGRFAPPAPARVLDVGGGPGVYASWLAGLGYDVTLVDPVPRHLDQARAVASAAAAFAVEAGDARALARADASVDLVLLLGPLYHLTGRADRVTAIGEARRVLRPGGTVIAASCGRFASLFDGMRRGFITDPEFVRMLGRTLAEGQHRNELHRERYFTTAYFHHPDELPGEFADGGFADARVLVCEGPGGIPDVAERLADPGYREALLALLRRVEAEPSLLGASSHLLTVAHAPAC